MESHPPKSEFAPDPKLPDDRSPVDPPRYFDGREPVGVIGDAISAVLNPRTPPEALDDPEKRVRKIRG